MAKSMRLKRENIVPVRLTDAEREEAERLAEHFGLSIAAVFRQGMKRWYRDAFVKKERDSGADRDR
jgi:hypothetical protein